MRQQLTFACEGETLFATLDDGTGYNDAQKNGRQDNLSANNASDKAGLLIVSGGNEVRSGAFAGQSQLARKIAARGFQVMRYDRRGIGESSGDNLTYRHSGPDIAAAIAAFRAQCPQISRVIAFGNCDAASALVLFHHLVPVEALVLANPWTFDDATTAEQEDTPSDEPAHSAASIRARYLAKLTDWQEVKRLLRGGVDLRKLTRGLARSMQKEAPSGLAAAMAESMAALPVRTKILLCQRDRTAQQFSEHWRHKTFSKARNNRHISVATLNASGHSFAKPDEQEWLIRHLIEILKK